MEILSTVLTVFFVILCVLLVILILLQSDKSSGMGLLGGSSQSTFGSSTSDVITKITSVMVALFFIFGISLAVIEAVKARRIDEGMTGGDKNGTVLQQPVKTDAAPAANSNPAGAK